MIGRQNVMHFCHFLLGLYHCPAILGRYVRFIEVVNLDAHVQHPFVVYEEVQPPFVINEEVLNADVQNLELRALVLVVSLFTTVPALYLTLWSLLLP